MSKERLEEIRQYLVLLHNAADVDDETKSYIFEDLKVEWLIERVQELEGELTYYKMATESYLDMEQQNKRYREAIEGVLKYKHVDQGLKNQLKKLLEDEE